MSSVAFTGTPAAPEIGARGTMASSFGGDYGGVANGNGGHGFGRGSGVGKTPFRHIDDLVSVGVDLNPHTPLRKVLETGDAHMRQAITYNDFRRPDLALQEYIKAFTIAVDKIPRHKDYPSMKSDRGDLNRLYNALKSKITSNGATFDKIKEDIKEDNRRSGVRPATASRSSSELAFPTHPIVFSKALPQAQTDGSAGSRKAASEKEPRTSDVDSASNGNGRTTNAKPKPAVHPKPQALHGKVIKQTSKASPDDLADRFARLRDSRKLDGPLRTTEQSGRSVSGESPLLHQPLPPVDTSTPGMPKLPEAIYSPARGTVTSEVANLPSSTSRGMFSRTNSIPSAPTASARMSTENAIRTFGREQFVTAHTYRAPQASTPKEVQIPAGDTITARALADLLNQDSPTVEILIIDIRDRDSFDEGHIQSSRTICVEPEILMRENISADEIADSMVLAPSTERLAIEQRDKVDLVVIYDQDSALIPARITGDSSEMVLYNIRQALSYYSYNRPLKDGPKLLRGGLDSWVDEFGEESLEFSNTVSSPFPPSGLSSHRSGGRRRFRRRAKTLSENEVRHFEDIINKDEAGLAAFDYVKSREDFIRRYPSITGAPESMTSPIFGLPGYSQEDDFLADISPAPPKRPAPAIPRTRYSGLDSRSDDLEVNGMAMAAGINNLMPQINQPLTGLENLGANSCYCNSVIQILLASPGFVDGILEPEWPENWHVSTSREPAKSQLLSKIVKNLLDWMHKKQFRTMRPQTLLRYMKAAHSGYAAGGIRLKLGDGHQHDVDEMLNFIFEHIAAETDLTSQRELDPDKLVFPDPRRRAVNFIARAHIEAMRTNLSYTFVDHHFLGGQTYENVCESCKHSTFNWDPFQFRQVAAIELPREDRGADGRFNPIEALFAREAFGDRIEWTCENCEQKTFMTRKGRLAALPRLLRITISRNMDWAMGKTNLTPISFPMVLDLTNLSWDAKTRRRVAKIVGVEYEDPFVHAPVYDLYGIIIHRGANATSGHYWAWVRVRGTASRDTWVRCDDQTCSAMSDDQWARELEGMYSCPGEMKPFVLFYKRRDVSAPWMKWK
ncbi:cysteine proteinase [Hypoxylon crocopeplum]|nr:cysteine proteinase [Hypoxylon crocopeplum]